MAVTDRVAYDGTPLLHLARAEDDGILRTFRMTRDPMDGNVIDFSDYIATETDGALPARIGLTTVKWHARTGSS